MKSAHEICGCLDGVNCALTIDRDRLMGRVNSAENRARLAEDRERVAMNEIERLTQYARVGADYIEMKHGALGTSSDDCNDECLQGEIMRWAAALDAQEPRT